MNYLINIISLIGAMHLKKEAALAKNSQNADSAMTGIEELCQIFQSHKKA